MSRYRDGTLVAVSAPLVMPIRDSDIPMNVPFTLRNKQPFPRTWNYNEFINKTGVDPCNNKKNWIRSVKFIEI